MASFPVRASKFIANYLITPMGVTKFGYKSSLCRYMVGLFLAQQLEHEVQMVTNEEILKFIKDIPLKYDMWRGMTCGGPQN